MLDLKLLREDPERIKAAARKKHLDVDVDRAVALEVRRREMVGRIGDLRAEQNRASKSIGKLPPEPVVDFPDPEEPTPGELEKPLGDIFLMISIRPADGVTNEVSFLSGYPFKKGSEVKASVGRKKFTLFTEGENAWAPSAEDDAALIDAFRRGAKAKVEGFSSRGAKTVDTFSLSGFTAALEAATGLCKT